MWKRRVGSFSRPWRRWTVAAVLLAALAGMAVGAVHWWQRRPLAGAREAYARQEWSRVIDLAAPFMMRGEFQPEAALLIARSLSRLDRARDAESAFAQVPLSVLTDDDLRTRSEALRQMRRWSQAGELYAELHRRRPKDGEVLKKLAVAQFLAGDLNGALEAAVKLESDKEQAAAANCILGVIHEVMGREDDAARCFAKVLVLDPDGKSLPVDRAKVVDKLVDNLASSGQFDEAEQYLRRALAQDPTADLFSKLAKLLLTRGDLPGAWEHWMAALHLDKRHAGALTGLGRLALSNRQPAEAIGWLKLARQSGSSDSRLEYMLSLAYRQVGRDDLAEEHAQEHRRLTEQAARSPKDERTVLGQVDARQALLLRARHAAESGEWLEAEGALSDLERQFPRDPSARQLREQLRARQLLQP